MKRLSCVVSAVALVGIISMIGCGGGGGPKPFNKAPEALTYDTTACIYTQGLAITPNNPHVTKTVTSYSVDPALPAGLSIDTATGVISGTPTAVQEAKKYIITASNDYGSTTATISIAVNLAPPSALSYGTTACEYTKGLAIAQNKPKVTGTVTKWSVTPDLPAGLLLGSDGIISGTPTVLQSAVTYTIKAANGYGSTSSDISITVSIAKPEALSYDTETCSYTLGFVIPINVPKVTGTVTEWSVTPDLPAGLRLTEAGEIAGTPTAEQAAKEYVIKASNTSGFTTVSISIKVSIAPPANLTYATTCTYTLGIPITPNMPTVTGTVTVWKIEPALPSGLTMNTTTGEITGTPESLQSTAEYTVTAANYNGSTTAALYISVEIAAPSALLYTTTACVYTKDLTIAENKPKVTGTVTKWSVTPDLPAGLILGSDGVISGKPTAVQSAASYTIKASNSSGAVTADISITVNYAAPALLSYLTTACEYTQGVVIASNTPTVSGTVTAWSVSPELPEGLSLTSSGEIAGTPTTVQTAKDYVIKASNPYGSTTATVSITVKMAPPSALTYTTAACVYTQGVVIAANTPHFTGSVTVWSVDPALPAGLGLNTATGEITGKPEVLQSAAEYTIKAENDSGSTSATISIAVNIAAPSGLTYSAMSVVYTKGLVISPNTPTVSGSVTEWSVTPALPAGLILGADGVISGTPTAVRAAAEYALSAKNSSGPSTAIVTITVNDTKPESLSYSKSSCVYSKDTVIADNKPTVTGSVTTWTVVPDLPVGLSLNTASGVISGKPTTVQSAADYVITAGNSGGTATATVTIAVNAEAPKDLSYSVPTAVYYENTLIVPNVPALTGSSNEWSISPALPAGMILDTTTGIITGTPAAMQKTTSYTITAKNAYGEASAALTMTVMFDTRTENLNYLFNNQTLGEVTLSFTVDEWNKMLGYYDLNPSNETCVHGDFEYAKDGTKLKMSDAGIRIRGNTSRRRPEGSNGTTHGNGDGYHHAHFSVDFEEWLTGDAENKMAGCLSDVILKWSKEDPSYVREMYSYDLFRLNGVWTAPRAAYTKLTIKIGSDTAYYGVYEIIEPANKQFLKARTTEEGKAFTNNKGNLWKCTGQVEGPDLCKKSSCSIGVEEVYLNDSLSKRYDYDLKTNKDKLAAAKTELVSFIEGLDALDSSGSDTAKAWFASKMDVDLFLKTYAINVLVGMWDDYWGNKNNYYLYFDKSGKLYFLPYDYDNTLGVSLKALGDAGIRNPLYWGDAQTRPLINKMLAVPEYKTIYKNYLASLSGSTSFFDSAVSIQRIKDWHNLIEASVSNDTGEDMVIADTVATWGSTDYYRLWTDESASVNFFKVKAAAVANMDNTISVTIDPAGGTMSDGSTASKTWQLRSGSTLEDMPTVSLDGFIFMGWVYSGDTDVYTPGEGQTVIASWLSRAEWADKLVYSISGDNATIYFKPSMFNLWKWDGTSWSLRSASEISAVYITGQFNNWPYPGSSSWEARKEQLSDTGSRYEITGLRSRYNMDWGFKFIVVFTDGSYQWVGANELVTSIRSKFLKSDNFTLIYY